MFSLTSAKAIYGTLFFTTTLSLGGVLANRSFLTATGLVGSYAGTVALINREKELPDSVSKDSEKYLNQKYTDLELDLNNRLEQLQKVFQELQLFTQQGDLKLQQNLDLLQKTVSVQLNELDSVPIDDREDLEQKYSELELDLNNRLDQLQEVSQALKLSTQEQNLKIEQDLDLLQKKVSIQLNELDSVPIDDREDLEQKCSELELDLNNRLDQLQEVFQALKFSTQEEDCKLKHDLDMLLKRVKLQHAKTQRCVQSNYDKLKHQVTELKGTVGQNTATLAKQSSISKATEESSRNDLGKSVEEKHVENPSHTRISKTIVFIDQSNFHHACEKIGIELDYGSLMYMLTPEVGTCEIRVYLGVYEPPSRKQQELNKTLKGLGYQVIQLPIAVYSDKNKKVMGDDVQLSCDLLTMIQNDDICDRDRIVLISGDGDFKPVLQQAKEKGIHVELIAHNPSHYLIPFVDRITRLNEIKYDICQYKQFETA